MKDERLVIIFTALAGWTGLLIQLPITIANSRALALSRRLARSAPEPL
jgi:hypothetical protein